MSEFLNIENKASVAEEPASNGHPVAAALVWLGLLSFVASGAMVLVALTTYQAEVSQYWSMAVAGIPTGILFLGFSEALKDLRAIRNAVKK